MTHRKRNRSIKQKTARTALVLLVLCLLVTIAAGCTAQVGSNGTAVVVKAKYPKMAQYPSNGKYWKSRNGQAQFSRWLDDLRTRQSLQYCSNGLTEFLRSSIPEIMVGADDENRIYSPLNVYLAMAILAELTDGNSRQQILDTLGSRDVETLRAQANTLWQANYCDDGVVTSLLANSLWLNEDLHFNKDTLTELAKHYYTSSYQGTMGSAEFDRSMQTWLNEQTHGLLTDQVSGLHMDPDAVLALISTIYYKAGWDDTFSESQTQEDIFHATFGDLTCDFMNRSSDTYYYWGEHFTSVYKGMEHDYGMWFILPDESFSVTDLLKEDEVIDFILVGKDWADKQHLTVHMSVPKFDITSQLDLKQALRTLGITDVFDRDLSDFSPATDDTAVYVSKVQHGARVLIDEECCEATAYVYIEAMPGAAPAPELNEIHFILDRPFLFVISNDQGLPLFVGTVQQPN